MVTICNGIRKGLWDKRILEVTTPGVWIMSGTVGNVLGAGGRQEEQWSEAGMRLQAVRVGQRMGLGAGGEAGPPPSPRKPLRYRHCTSKLAAASQSTEAQGRTGQYHLGPGI